jgi:2TM domain
MNPDLSPDQLDRLAAKRAGMKIGFCVHAAVYMAVNTGLYLLSASQGKAWAIYPALGWGLGLLLHGGVTWLAMPGSGWRERMVARERRLLDPQRP